MKRSPARLVHFAPFGLASCVASLALAAPAAAAPPEDTTEAAAADPIAVSPERSGDRSKATAPPDPDRGVERGVDSHEQNRGDVPWLRRWAPERNMGEIGIYGGLFLPADNHDFYSPDSLPQKPLWKLNGDVGLRAAFFPLEYLGIEAEGGVMPVRIRNSTNDPSLVWTARGHLVAQLPMWSVVPFLVVGGGAVGVRSNPILLGNDVDPAMHWGLGLKVFLNRWLALRVEGRHTLTARAATQRSFTNHFEILAGLSVTLGRAKPKPILPPNPDRDGDGFKNEVDSCPDTPGVSPDGCPPRDTDEDGFLDVDDACPYEAGVDPDGCPKRDTDGDGFTDDVDACIDRPETVNGYKDDDGCPDELPDDIVVFSGVIEGIEFDHDSSEVTASSKETLDRALEVLDDYPDIRIEIVGHTDNEGSAEYNRQLSKDRADAVRAYLIEGGTGPDRLETRGAGQSEPRASNDSEAGRAKNRRTEFKLIKTSHKAN